MSGPGPVSDTLNLGSGHKKVPEAVNLDVTPDTGPDVVHDLDVRPWPFPDDRFGLVLAFDVLEHLDDLLGAFEEIHRVCRHGARVRLAAPHFSSANAYADPTHRRAFAWSTVDYVTGESEHAYYTRARFKVVQRQLVFQPSWLNKIVWRLANRHPRSYEARWAWLFPAWFVSVELEVLKPAGPQGTPG